METTKPRMSLDEYMRISSYAKGSIALLIEQFIREMNGADGKPPVKVLGRSHAYSLRLLQRSPHIGPKFAAELTKGDVIAHCRARKEAGILPQTIQQDFTYLSGALKYAGSAWDDCDGLTDAALVAAGPFVRKHGLISKAPPRTRRPTGDELDGLEAHFAAQNAHPNTVIDMVKVSRWQVASGRRISESCRLLWSDWNREAHTILVRKMKDPKVRDKQKVVALPDEAQALLCEWWETRDPAEPRILPYDAKSAGARYTKAKHALGIVGLRLHDSRRHCGSNLVEKGYSPAQAILVTGHETTAIFERVYMKVDPASFKEGPRSPAIQVVLDQNKSQRLDPMTPRQAKEADESWVAA